MIVITTSQSVDLVFSGGVLDVLVPSTLDLTPSFYAVSGGVTLAGGTLALPYSTVVPLTLDGPDNVLFGPGGAGPINDGTIPGGLIIEPGYISGDLIDPFLGVTLEGDSFFSLGVTLASGALELATPDAAGSGPITIAPGSDAVLQIDGTIMPTNSIAGFAPGDIITLPGIAYSPAMIATDAGGTLTLSSGGSIDAELALAATASLVAEPDPSGSGQGDGTALAFAFQAIGSGAWTSSGEWAPGAVPSGADDVALTAPGSYTVTVDGTQSVGALDINDAGATLAIDPSAVLAENFGITLDAGVLRVAGVLVGGQSSPISFNDIPVFPIGLTAAGGELDVVGSGFIAGLALSLAGDTPLILNAGTSGLSADLLQPGSIVASGNLTLYGTTATGFFAGGTLSDQATAATIVMTGSAASQVTMLGTSTATSAAIIAGAGADTISALGGAATIFGGSGPLTFVASPAITYALPGADISPTLPYSAELVGGSGAVTATGASSGTSIVDNATASNLFFGGSSGGNVLVSGNVASTLVGGGSGDMLVENGSIAGLLVAGPGAETLTAAGATGGNIFFGGAGSDVLVAGSAADTMLGGSGQQTIFGSNTSTSYILAGAGDDLVVAGAAQNYIAAGSGSAVVFAGPGDLFGVVNGQAGGELEIVGFSTGSDRLQLQGYGGNAASTALASEAVFGGTTVLTLPDATRIILLDVANLGSSAFL